MTAHSTTIRWLKFNAVGGIGIGVQLATVALLTNGLRVNYLLATALAVEAAVIHNFLWHERFTWAHRVRVSVRESALRFIKFNLTTGLFSILGNVVLMGFLIGRVGLPHVPANLVTVAICSIANFLVSDRFVFRVMGVWSA